MIKNSVFFKQKPLAVFLLFFIFIGIHKLNAKNINKEIQSYKIALVNAVKLARKKSLSSVYKSIQFLEQIIDKTKSKANSKFIEVNLFARQVVAGIYLHRLKKWKNAAAHYGIIIKHGFFQKNAPNVVKWLVYEGNGIAYFVGKKYKSALSNFFKSYKVAKKIIKVKKGKGKSSLCSTAYNIAAIYATLKNAKKTAKYIKISLRNTINTRHKQIIKFQIRKDKAFKHVIKSKLIVKLIK